MAANAREPSIRVVTPDSAELRRTITLLQSEQAHLAKKVSALETEAAAMRETIKRLSERLARVDGVMATPTRRPTDG